jgi:hypothetical protein
MRYQSGTSDRWSWRRRVAINLRQRHPFGREGTADVEILESGFYLARAGGVHLDDLELSYGERI